MPAASPKIHSLTWVPEACLKSPSCWKSTRQGITGHLQAQHVSDLNCIGFGGHRSERHLSQEVCVFFFFHPYLALPSLPPDTGEGIHWVVYREKSKGRSVYLLNLRLWVDKGRRPDDGEVSWAGEELKAPWIYRNWWEEQRSQ